MILPLASPLVRAALTPAARATRRAWSAPEEAQRTVRERLWRGARETAYGGRFRTFDEVPVVAWEDVAPWMVRQQAGDTCVIVPERVMFWEPTSGSGGAPKRIPYTASLRRSFSRMFAVWAHDLLANGPRFQTGQVWFSVTPRFHDLAPAGDGVPVGTQDDRDYLDGPLRALLSPWLRSPDGLAGERDPEAWRRRLCGWLVQQRDLEVMSVWSPTLLTVLLDWMKQHVEALPRSVAVGDWRAVWPRLKLISCWEAGSAAAPASRVREAFPGVTVQGKGLLATEAPVTVPLVGLEAGAPLVGEVLLELLSDGGDLVPIHRAEEGRSYEVVVSQGAGLLRYRLGDVVEVRGRVLATPALRFVGRARTSDLVGEKLTEAVVAEVFRAEGVPAGGALVARGDRYVLELDAHIASVGLAERVEARLATQHHYRLARELGQLAPVELALSPGRARRDLDSAPQWGAAKGSVLRAG